MAGTLLSQIDSFWIRLVDGVVLRGCGVIGAGDNTLGASAAFSGNDVVSSSEDVLSVESGSVKF